ncbi:glyoxalase [Chroococcidiopsis sp. CCALA 051]|uniref:VOC family protein n=1 Tax=Chroococcidiopsis sp. CCALA 051 TaxID=869949 RepID=UPI000D0DDB4C|nr:VOC family protein [Chroococcidiopsis sp. CCALA 051]MBE9017037.1 VOC family protein [Chroococcidiopsidales cyanobacterium LEGE 13417]PSM46370.1 glyoxalase [Chroococcidiopsis sp. CCALA 051]
MVLNCTNSLVTLATQNFELLVNFYQQFLEQTPLDRIPNIYAEFQVTGLRLGIFKPKVSNQAEFMNSTQSSMSLCLEVKDLEAAIAHLTKIGCPPPGQIVTASHGREIYAYDPDGNRIILHSSSK